MEEEEESSCPCVECKFPRELLLHREQLIPPLEIGFERFEENIWIVQQYQQQEQCWNSTVVLGDGIVSLFNICLGHSGSPFEI